ncbi:MAG: transposase, partial [Tsuneonella sp.]
MPYPADFRAQMVELVKSGRTPEELAREFEPTAQTIINWVAQALPNERIALQWDVCQEVIAWEGYYEPGPVDFRKETIAELIAIGDGVPATIELGYHLCYGSPAD